VIEAVFPDRAAPRSTTRSSSRGRRDRRSEDDVEIAAGKGPVPGLRGGSSNLGDERVRAVAMDTTDGLSRGTEVIDSGRRSRFRSEPQRSGGSSTAGEPIVPRGRPPADTERWPIHRAAPTVEALIPTTEMFETGIRSSTCWRRTAKGGKVGLFGGAGVGKTGDHPELIHKPRPGARWPVGVLRAFGERSREGNDLLARDEGIGPCSTKTRLGIRGR